MVVIKITAEVLPLIGVFNWKVVVPVTVLWCMTVSASATATPILFGIEIDNDRLFTINLATGAGTSVGVLAGTQVEGLAFAPDTQHFFGVDNSNHTLVDIQIDPIGWSFAQDLPYGTYTNVARSPLTGDYYTLTSGTLAIIDTTTGAVTSIGVNGVPIESLAFNSLGRLFGVGDIPAPGQEALYEFDVASGAVVASVPIVSDLANPRFDGSLAIDPITGVFYSVAAIDGGLYRIDTSSGIATRIGSTGFRNIRSLEFADIAVPADRVPVPEPSALSMAVLGLAMWGGHRTLRARPRKA